MSRWRRFARAAARDFRHLGQIDARTFRDLFRATLELALARWRLATATPAELLDRKHSAVIEASGGDAAVQAKRVAFAIGAMGARVPWRSDCLVQALAGHRWLSRLGVASDLCIGVRHQAKDAIEAHAWLRAGGEVVIGGQVTDYAPLIARGDR